MISVSETMLAWEVEIHAMTCIVFATTKAKAQWIATSAYWEAFERNGWPRAKAWRAERYDASALRNQGRRAWSPEYVRDYPDTERKAGG